MPLDFHLIPCRSDNYAVLIHDKASNTAALVDAPAEAPIVQKLERLECRLTHILITHHHFDHVEALPALKTRTGASVIAPAAETSKIASVDMPVKEGSEFDFAGQRVKVLDVPGHTLGHVAYYMPGEQAVFVGDTLFVLGCGRLLEGTAQMMWDSLQKLAALPEATRAYCGHEYGLSNARFALTVEPENAQLQWRAREIEAARKTEKSVMPTTIGFECATNPFLRAANVQEFAERRRRKDGFKG